MIQPKKRTRGEGVQNPENFANIINGYPFKVFCLIQCRFDFSMLDVECSVRGFPETYVQKVKVQHKDNKKLFEPKHCDITRTFGIHHYAGQVVYDTSDFLGE